MIQKCVCCGSELADSFRSEPTEIRPAVPLRRCGACGLVSQDGAVEDFDAGLYDYYQRLFGQSPEKVYGHANDRQARKVLTTLKRELDRTVPTSAPALLDVGCGVGLFTKVAHEAGWKARGIDLSQSAVAVGQSFGVPLEVVDFFDAAVAPSSADMIVMSEFIEHVAQPQRFLQRAEEVVRPGGLIHLTTPNYDSLDRRLANGTWRAIGPEHLFYFTPRTFERLVTAHTGLEIVSITTRNLTPSIIVSKVKGALPGRRRPQHDGYGAAAAQRYVPQEDMMQRLRENKSVAGALFQAAKVSTNVFLSALNLGNTMAVTLRRPIGPALRAT